MSLKIIENEQKICIQNIRRKDDVCYYLFYLVEKGNANNTRHNKVCEGF